MRKSGLRDKSGDGVEKLIRWLKETGIYYINSLFALVVYDYLVALMAVAWLFFFWWFSYAFVLEQKTSG